MMFESLNSAIDAMAKLKTDMENTKLVLLSNFFKSQPNGESSIKMLLENGLPKNIYCHTNCDDIIITAFSEFSPVHKSQYVSPGKIVFSWVDQLEYES